MHRKKGLYTRVYFIVHGSRLRKTFGAGKYLAIKNKIRYDYSVDCKTSRAAKEKNMDTVFFDMDGTLIDTEKYYNVCWCEAIAKFGYTITKEEALDLRSLGRPHVYRFFEEKYGKGFPYDEMRAYRKKIMEEMLKRDGITVKPGAKEILLWLKSRQIRCMIATATDLERTNRYLEMAGLSSYFDEIISAVMVKSGKLACEKAGRMPSDCIAIEDSPNGVRAAAAAGCRVFMIPDLDEPDEATRALCEGVFLSLSELRRHFVKIL